MAKEKNNITLSLILKDSNYNLSLFSEKDIKALETQIIVIKNKPFVINK